MSYNDFMQTVAQIYDSLGGTSMKKWRFGRPIPTYATVERQEEQTVPCPYPALKAKEPAADSGLCWEIPLKPDDFLFGLGQNLGGINKRGRRYVSYCTDDPHHTEDKEALYAAHNVLFIVRRQGEVTTLFWDTPGRIIFDCGFTHDDTLAVTAESGHLDFYVSHAQGLTEAISEFRRLIGKPYMPPKWAFGYFQSRWGYASEDDLLEVKACFDQHHIPLEGIYVDIDYMERFKDFTIDKVRYPDFKGLVQRFKGDGQYLVPIIDAGVKIEKDYPVYEEGIAQGHFVTDDTGKPYVAAVWPGRVHFPDFMQEKTQRWFGDWYRFLIELGIEGIWNDMNEPAIFYDETALTAAIDKAVASKGENLDIHSYFALGDAFRQLSNQDAYYQRMRHHYEGEVFSNHALHNLYGYLMTKSADMGFEKHLADKRPLILSRASTIGMHRHGGIWTGDNSSWWSHLALNVKQMPALSAVGFLYSGADTGGFGGHASGELLSRWLQFSVFTPLLRNHSALGTRVQEPYQFGERYTAINRQLIQLRYRLLPLLYSEFLKAYHLDKPLFTPLCAHYSDDRVFEIEDQIMLGDSIMLVPVVTQNATGRRVYLPEPMTLVTLGAYGERTEDYPQGDHYLPYPLEGLQFFIRPGAAVPIVDPANTTRDLQADRVVWLGSLKLAAQAGHMGATYTWYDDDGITRSTLKMAGPVRRYSFVATPQGVTITENAEGLGTGSWHPHKHTRHQLNHIL